MICLIFYLFARVLMRFANGFALLLFTVSLFYLLIHLFNLFKSIIIIILIIFILLVIAGARWSSGIDAAIGARGRSSRPVYYLTVQRPWTSH